MEYERFTHDHRALQLLERYQQRRINERECEELQRWLERFYLHNPQVPADKKLEAAMVWVGVNAKKIDLQVAAGRFPPPEHR